MDQNIQNNNEPRSVGKDRLHEFIRVLEGLPLDESGKLCCSTSAEARGAFKALGLPIQFPLAELEEARRAREALLWAPLLQHAGFEGLNTTALSQRLSAVYQALSTKSERTKLQQLAQSAPETENTFERIELPAIDRKAEKHTHGGRQPTPGKPETRLPPQSAAQKPPPKQEHLPTPQPAPRPTPAPTPAPSPKPTPKPTEPTPKSTVGQLSWYALLVHLAVTPFVGGFLAIRHNEDAFADWVDSNETTHQFVKDYPEISGEVQWYYRRLAERYDNIRAKDWSRIFSR
jgi:hypothetical protein